MFLGQLSQNLSMSFLLINLTKFNQILGVESVHVKNNSLVQVKQ